MRIKPNLIMTLYKLAELGAYPKKITCSTKDLGKKLDISQQTASRQLIELEKEGLIKRIKIGRKEAIQITKEGIDILRDMQTNLQRILEGAQDRIIMTGELFSGLGEGAYYISHEGYAKQFKEKLGFKPYPGTLNLRIKREDVWKKKLIEECSPIIIDGFSNDVRNFGSVKCCRVLINGRIEGEAIFALRTHYSDDVIEIIAPYDLRDKLKLKNKAKIKITVVNPRLSSS